MITRSGRCVFVSFADSRMVRSLHRISAQARAMETFSAIQASTEVDLDPDFRARFAHKLQARYRGFGYWVWKPQILLQAFARANAGDVVIYCDAGCHLNPRGRTRMLEYLSAASAAPCGVLAFQNKPWLNRPEEKRFWLPDRCWTKGDLIDYFTVRGRPDIIDTGTIGSTALVLRVGEPAQRLLESWLAAYDHDFTLADDSQSRAPNLSGFIEHRHDQAIWSILCKLNDVPTASAFEYWYPSATQVHRANWGILHDRPIWAKRDRDLGMIGNLRSSLTHTLKRARKMPGRISDLLRRTRP